MCFREVKALQSSVKASFRQLPKAWQAVKGSQEAQGKVSVQAPQGLGAPGYGQRGENGGGEAAGASAPFKKRRFGLRKVWFQARNEGFRPFLDGFRWISGSGGASEGVRGP